MKNANRIMIIIALAMVLSPQNAQARVRHHLPRAAHQHHTHVHAHAHAGVDRTAAYADIVIDAETGQIIHETDSDDLRHPASLTKMMTLYLTFQALDSGRLDLNQYMHVSENASYQSPSKLGLRAGQRIRVEDAILGVVTESANDAAVVLAEALGGSESAFADVMTRQAQTLGMTRTRFCNPSGLPNPDQVTTAHDMAILGAALINHYPRYYPYFSHDSFTYAGIYHHNHNHLMDRYDGMDGIKTGYIRASGFNLVASVKRGGRRIVAVIFGGHSAVARDNQMAQLLDQSFAVVEAKNRVQTVAVQGEGDSVDKTGGGDEVLLPAKAAAASPPLSPPLSASPSPIPAPSPSAPVAQVDAPQIPQETLPLPQKVAFHPEAPKARPARRGAWGVQIGAYSNAEVGRQALAGLVSSMPGLPFKPKPQVQKIAAGGIVLYRARLMSLDKNTAQSLCAQLNQSGKSCLTVEP